MKHIEESKKLFNEYLKLSHRECSFIVEYGSKKTIEYGDRQRTGINRESSYRDTHGNLQTSVISEDSFKAMQKFRNILRSIVDYDDIKELENTWYGSDGYANFHVIRFYYNENCEDYEIMKHLCLVLAKLTVWYNYNTMMEKSRSDCKIDNLKESIEQLKETGDSKHILESLNALKLKIEEEENNFKIYINEFRDNVCYEDFYDEKRFFLNSNDI